MAKFYMATMFVKEAKKMAQTVGITAHPKTGVVPLCSEQYGAIARFLHDAAENGNMNPAKIRNVFLFEIELPKNIKPKPIDPDNPDLKQYHFVGYKGTIPPQYIKDCFIVDLYDKGKKEGDPVYNVNTMFFAVPESKAKDVEKNGFTMPDAIPGAPRGVVLTIMLEEAVPIYAPLYKTKENGITSLAIFSVKFPPVVQLEADFDITLPGDNGPIRCFSYQGKIPPEYLTGETIVKLKPGGMFA